jgi:acyl carrier protein
MEAKKENETLKEIVAILREYKGQPDLAVTLDTKFESLELDSLDTVDLVMQIEDKMGVTIEMSKDIQTVGNIVDIIEQQKPKQ